MSVIVIVVTIDFILFNCNIKLNGRHYDKINHTVITLVTKSPILELNSNDF